MFLLRPTRAAAVAGTIALLLAAGIALSSFGTPWRLAVSVPTSTLHAAVSAPILWATWALFAVVCASAAAMLLLLFLYIDRRNELVGLHRELARVSRLDSLTGVHNRLHLDEQLAAMLSYARRHRQPVAVLLVDIDNFKSINDGEGGHAAGDRVLQEVAEQLRRDARAEDVVGRWGGDEFMILMPNTDVASAKLVGERLLDEQRSTAVDAGGTFIPVSVSVGAAAGIDFSPDEMEHRADLALYEAKRGGRARVVTIVEDPSTLRSTPAAAPASAPASAAN